MTNNEELLSVNMKWQILVVAFQSSMFCDSRKFAARFSFFSQAKYAWITRCSGKPKAFNCSQKKKKRKTNIRYCNKLQEAHYKTHTSTHPFNCLPVLCRNLNDSRCIFKRTTTTTRGTATSTCSRFISLRCCSWCP